MRARVVTAQFKPDKIDAAVALYQQQLSALREEPGCEGALLLTDRSTGQALSVSMWATETALQASETPLRQRVTAFQDLLAGQPTVETREVGVCDLSGSDAA